MPPHPYRSPAARPARHRRSSDGWQGSFEGAALEAVLVAVGALGVVAGIINPYRCDFELIAGSFLLFIVVRDRYLRSGTTR